MNWLQVQIDLGTISWASVEQSLLDLGAASIHLSNGGDEAILEPEPGTVPLWTNIRLDALFGQGISESSIMLAIAATVSPAPMPATRFSIIEDQDWVANWKTTLQPTRFGEHLWICPPEIPCPDNRGIRVTMEPGLGFGTGDHPTTALCLDWLAHQPLGGKSLLDFGCGSGILAIAGLALGAESATAVDSDPQALTATGHNARRNSYCERLQVMPPNLLDPAETFEFIVANILSRTLIDLAPTIAGHARSGTMIALSGILASQVEEVSAAYAQWVDFEPVDEVLDIDVDYNHRDKVPGISIDNDRRGRRQQWVILYGSVT